MYSEAEVGTCHPSLFQRTGQPDTEKEIERDSKRAVKKEIHRAYSFGPFRIDLEQLVLLRNGDPVPLTPKAFATLQLLVENRGRVVNKGEFMKAIWPDT